MSKSKTIRISDDQALNNLIRSNPIVVIYFHATGCELAPAYETFASTLTPRGIVFTKCDVADVTLGRGITVVPTFIIFKEKKIFGRVEGANRQALTEMLNSLVSAAAAMGKDGGSSAASGSASGASDSTPSNAWSGAPIAKGYRDISEEIEKKGLDMLNNIGTVRALFEETSPFENSTTWVESDTDEQLMIYIPFRSTLKLHSIHITSIVPSGDDAEEVEGSGGDDPEEVKLGRPRTLRFYTNRPTIVGFDEANRDQITPTQEITLTPEDWDKKTRTAVINTKFVKFQSIFSLTIFVFEGEEGCEKTKVDRIKLVGEAGEKRDLGKLEKVQQQE